MPSTPRPTPSTVGLRKQEARLMKAASHSRDAGFSNRLEEKIPAKVQYFCV